MERDYAFFLVKLTLNVTEKKLQKITVSFPSKLRASFKKCPPPPPPQNNQTLSIPYLLQALLLLACYCGSTTICRRNGNCEDPNQTYP